MKEVKENWMGRRGTLFGCYLVQSLVATQSFSGEREFEYVKSLLVDAAWRQMGHWID